MINVYCDGGSRGNPGPAAYGFVVKVGCKTIKSKGGTLGIATNNFAEYTAVIKALMWLSDNYEREDLNFFLDSQLAASQLSGIYKVKNARIRELVLKIKSLETSFGQIKYTHIPREKNLEADAMVNIALDENI
ncbi:MAG: ribonuclease HI family protein [Candidatus Curtissbacteria bacterium]|nr:ribonuclease HI family protein [Candidatus Curtissbacteria bacterium]